MRLVSNYPRLDVAELRLVSGQMVVEWGGGWIRIERQPGNLGGAFPVLICPDCGRRCRHLYLSGERPSCRKCLGLCHASQLEGPADRSLRRADEIRRSLGWRPGIIHGVGDKPPRMRWVTYFRQVRRYIDSVNDWIKAMR